MQCGVCGVCGAVFELVHRPPHHLCSNCRSFVWWNKPHTLFFTRPASREGGGTHGHVPLGWGKHGGQLAHVCLACVVRLWVLSPSGTKRHNCAVFQKRASCMGHPSRSGAHGRDHHDVGSWWIQDLWPLCPSSESWLPSLILVWHKTALLCRECSAATQHH